MLESLCPINSERKTESVPFMSPLVAYEWRAAYAMTRKPSLVSQVVYVCGGFAVGLDPVQIHLRELVKR